LLSSITMTLIGNADPGSNLSNESNIKLPQQQSAHLA